MYAVLVIIYKLLMKEVFVMIRIKDIAERAGVSPTTVSNVIHGNRKKVSAETIEKIESIIRETNYVPSMGARLLAGNHSNIIGVIMGGRKQTPGILDPFIGSLLSAIELEIYKYGYYMMFHMTKSSEENLYLTTAWNVDGLVTLGLTLEDNLYIQTQGNIPVVAVDGYFKEEKIGNIGLDDFDGGYQMAKHLIENGHIDFLFLSDENIGVNYYRWLGVKEAFKEAGIPIADDHHVIIPQGKEERLKFHEKNMKKYLEHTALFFTSDFYAVEAITFFAKHGISVPDKISIAGFDNSIYATIIHPALTTVKQDISMKGSLAVEHLVKMIKEESRETFNVKLPVSLVIRDSVKTIYR